MNRWTVDSVHGGQLLMYWNYIGFILATINWDKNGRDHKII